MKHSPFFCLLFLTFIFSCKNLSKNELTNSSETKSIENPEALSLQKKADSLYSISKFNDAFFYYNKSKILFDPQQHSDNIAYCLIQMARLQQISDDYFGSESTLIEALKFSKNNNQYLSALNNLLGIASKELKNYKQALVYYHQCYKLATDEQAKCTALNNIAKIYSLQNNHNKAIAIWNKIINKKFLDTLPTKKALYIDNLGYSYLSRGERTKAIYLMNQALEIKLKANDIYGSIESYLHLTEFYFDKNKNLSEQFAQKAYQSATQNNSIDERLKALLYLVKINPKKEVALKYAILNDSIVNIRNTAKNQFAKIKYDAKVTEEENLKLKNTQIQTELELEKSENEKDFWLVIAVLLISLVLFLVNYFRNKNLKEKQKATYLTETRIAKKIHDELANDVFQTISFVEANIEDEPQNKIALINLLDTIYQQSRNISKENESIETGEYFYDSLIAMIDNYKTNQGNNVIIKKDDSIDWQKIDDIKKITIFRVVQELLVNMKKHSAASIVVMSFSNAKNNIQIDYSDNGKGLELEKVIKGGLVNVENRIRNINGKIIFDSASNGGLKVKLNIPK